MPLESTPLVADADAGTAGGFVSAVIGFKDKPVDSTEKLEVLPHSS